MTSMTEWEAARPPTVPASESSSVARHATRRERRAPAPLDGEHSFSFARVRPAQPSQPTPDRTDLSERSVRPGAVVASSPSPVSSSPISQSTSMSPADQKLRVAARAADKREDIVEVIPKKTHRTADAETTSESRSKAASASFPARDRLTSQEEKPTLQPTKTDERAATRVAQQQVPAQPNAREQRVIERKLERVTIREKPAPSETKREARSTSRSSPQTILTAIARNKIDRSKARPIFSESSIAPLTRLRPEPAQPIRSDSQPQPTVQVTIGRIEVRAVQSPQSPTRPRPKTPVLSLDEYLRQRSQGGTR
jgi:hypothetical protein